MNKYEVTTIIPGDSTDYSEIIEAESYSPNGDYIEFYTKPKAYPTSERVASYLQPLKVRKLRDEISDVANPNPFEEIRRIKNALLDRIYGQYVSAHLRSLVNPRWCVNEYRDLETIRSLTTEDGQLIWAPASKIGDPDTLLGYPIKVSRDFFVGAPTLT